MACRPDLRIHVVLVAALAMGGAALAAPGADRLAEAAEALERGDGIAAEVAVRQALDAGTPSEDVAALIGEAELLQGDLSDARGWLGPGEFSAATRVQGFHALARLEMQEGDLAAAAAAFDRSLQTGAATARLWVDIGRLRYLAGQHHLALDASARAMAIGPEDPRALEFRAQLVRDAQGVRAALPLFERALEIAPDDMGLLGEYASTLAEAGRHRDMLRIARRMTELDPRHPRAYYLQAVLAARAGLDNLARRLLSRTRGAYDDVPAGQLLAGILELRNGNTGLAVDRLDELARRQPENAMAQLLLARALLDDGEATEVIARLGPPAERADASPYLLTLVGRAYEQLGRRGDAAGYLDRAADARVTTIGVLAAGSDAVGPTGDVALIRHMLAQGKAGEAAGRTRALKAQYPDSVDVEILSGDVSLLTGEPAAALAIYDRAARVRRDFALVERIVAAQQALGRKDAALAALATYLARNPRSAPASAMLGRMLAERGDREQARLLLGHAHDLRPGDGNLLADLAEVAFALGEVGPAEEAAREAYRLNRASRGVAATLARVLAVSESQGAEARTVLAKARSLRTQAELARR